MARPGRQRFILTGVLIKTLYLLRFIDEEAYLFIDDEAYRRRILVQLNRGECRHQFARVVFHGKRGELRQRYREGQEDQLGSLSLVVNVIVLWNTICMDAALNQLRAEGLDVRAKDVTTLSMPGQPRLQPPHPTTRRMVPGRMAERRARADQILALHLVAHDHAPGHGRAGQTALPSITTCPAFSPRKAAASGLAAYAGGVEYVIGDQRRRTKGGDVAIASSDRIAIAAEFGKRALCRSTFLDRMRRDTGWQRLQKLPPDTGSAQHDGDLTGVERRVKVSVIPCAQACALVFPRL